MTTPHPVVRLAASRRPEQEWFSRREAARYLTSIGQKISNQTLANMAANRNRLKGPPFDRVGWNGPVRYRRADLDAWATTRTERIA